MRWWWLGLALAVLLASCGGLSAQTPTPSPTPSPSPSPAPTPSPTPAPTPEPTPSPTPAPTPTPGPTLLIVNGTLIDGTGAPPLPGAWVSILGDRILNVGTGEPPHAPGATVIDADGQTIMPGLIDTHAHTTRLSGGVAGVGINPVELRAWVYSGVTGLRDVASAPGLLPVVRPQVEELVALGQAPRVAWAGPMITTTGGYPLTVPRYSGVGYAVHGVEAARETVATLADQGATLIKLGLDEGMYGYEGWKMLSLDEIRTFVEEANARGMLVTAHVTSVKELELALDGGLHDLAHTPIEPIPEHVMQRMLERQMGITSTVTIWRSTTSGREIAAANAATYVRAGGILALGTDHACCGQTAGMEHLLHEMRSLINAGLTPMEVIVAGTRNGAIVSNLGDDLGTIEPGKLADIIVVSGDPLQNINALRYVTNVIVGGVIVR